MTRLVWGDQAYDVDVQETAQGLRVVVGERELTPRVEAVGPATFVWRDGERCLTFHCLRDGDTVHLFWRGQAFRLRLEGRRGGAAARPAADSLEAPMPGRVIAVKVAAGQAVVKGQELLVVESMKMENALRAPRDGRVLRVAAQVGDMVAPGTVLVELEPQGV